MKQIILLLIIATLTGCFGAEPQKTGKEGKPMPSFTLELLDSITRLHSQDIPYGTPTVLFYFSPYCPHCNAQTNKIIEDMDRLKDIQFYFISRFTLTEVKAFQKEHQLAKYPNIVIGLDSANFINDYFEIAGIPYFAIYGKDKKLNKTFLGRIYSSQLKKVAEE
ncbi:hypothetical protein A4H97_22935 [Niastella yeongjuensis]|uniref:Thioredoxin domain-containing protein n=1 Tax=Niastella yeongjuensis TaxID=354355 RepID=A0A1V9F7U3_9BACT|nr:redoxin domain-containing protein [Niastella yeongjuensis]OQP54341.1 hypothetical protein A4H97_22935 [Niastella yeongjuensis]SEP29862.1 AhpC/TSA family protein [Niastella yeongjuensis]